MMNSMESTAVDTELARVVRLGCGARECIVNWVGLTVVVMKSQLDLE